MLSKITGLSLEGINYTRDIKVGARAYKNFPETDEERAMLVKGKKDYVDIDNIDKLWASVLKAIMEYFTLEGRYTRVYNYHFTLVNHFRHKVLISFPYYLYWSLNQSIADHRQRNSQILHVGLINLIAEFAKNHIPDAIPPQVKKRKSDARPPGPYKKPSHVASSSPLGSPVKTLPVSHPSSPPSGSLAALQGSYPTSSSEEKSLPASPSLTPSSSKGKYLPEAKTSAGVVDPSFSLHSPTPLEEETPIMIKDSSPSLSAGNTGRMEPDGDVMEAPVTLKTTGQNDKDDTQEMAEEDKVSEDANRTPPLEPRNSEQEEETQKIRNTKGSKDKDSIQGTLHDEIHIMDRQVRRAMIMTTTELVKNKSVISYDLDNRVQADIAEIKTRYINTENKMHLLEAGINELRKDISAREKGPDNKGIDEKIKEAVREAMIPIHKKAKENEDMIKHLLALVKTGMKVTLENLISLINWLEANKDGPEVTSSSLKQKGPGTRTRSKVQRNDDPEIKVLKENVQVMQDQLEEAENYLKSMLED